MATKLSVTLVNSICESIENGLSLVDAALVAGVEARTVDRWLGGEAINEWASALPSSLPQVRKALAFQDLFLDVSHRKDDKRKGTPEDPDYTLSLPQKKLLVQQWLNLRIKQAEAKCKAIHIHTITQASAKSWQASAWILERSFPDRYALRTKTENTSSVKITVLSSCPRPKRTRKAQGMVDEK